MLFLLKGIRLLIWETKDLNVGGKGPINVNFASLGPQIKFIDTMKHYLSSLGSLLALLMT